MDYSGSMMTMLGSVREEVHQQIKDMLPTESFGIVVMREPLDTDVNPGEPWADALHFRKSLATHENKLKALLWTDDRLYCVGDITPLVEPTLQYAFSLKPNRVVLSTDGYFVSRFKHDTPSAVVANLNIGKRVRVDVLVAGHETNEGCDELAKVAKDNGGTIKFFHPDPVIAIQNILPDGWFVLRVVTDTYPGHRPKGRGTAIYLASPQHPGHKEEEDAVVYLMPLDYDDGGDDPTHGQEEMGQTWPARLLGSADANKVYLWGNLGTGAVGWPTMRADICKALGVPRN